MVNEIHVVPNGDKWEITRAGDANPLATFDTQAQAAERGRAQARSDQVEFLLHAGDGTVREKDSYGNDPRDIPG